MLTHWGMRPTAVSSGSAALAAIERARADGDPFALVLTDAEMPEMDGFALARADKGRARLRRDDPHHALVRRPARGRRPVPRNRHRRLPSKPVTQGELLETILTATGGLPRPGQQRTS